MIFRQQKKNIRYVFLLLSLCSLTLGVLCYLLFRESNLLVNDILNIQFFNISINSDNMFFNFIRYNLPDGLWLVSGILLLRFIWGNDTKNCNIYICVFILFALFLEIFQYFNIVPGTFDTLDLITMVLFAFLEHIIYKFKFRGVKQNVSKQSA